ncbi:MAG: hypothetical protein FJ125_16580, partial [Deltaproteobacteria bacterium]|nr:hypothetical protein [Deltaproteobacteria bacterium]
MRSNEKTTPGRASHPGSTTLRPEALRLVLGLALGLGILPQLGCLPERERAEVSGIPQPTVKVVQGLEALVAIDGCDELVERLRARTRATMVEALTRNLADALQYGGCARWAYEDEGMAPTAGGGSEGEGEGGGQAG